jgi:UDP-2,3-diacylglucosamine pyrophosphatase LpxH
MRSSGAREGGDIVVVSDLHLGEGKHPMLRRYSPTEDFFRDRSFSRFLEKLAVRYKDDPGRLRLVFNGDTFDFLTVTAVPSEEEAAERGIKVSAAERKFGLNPTEEKSVYKLDIIHRGHYRFFVALARFVAAGFQVEIIRGNHDIELFFPSVRQRVLEHLAACSHGPDMETAKRLVRFHDWFYFEPGRVFIEHGNQYDTTNSVRYPLHPVHSTKGLFSPGEEEVIDYPLGSIFVRYYYNRVRRLDPYTPRLLTFDQYLYFVRRYNLFDIWRVYRDHYPHFIAALGPATPAGSSGFTQEDDLRQEEDFRAAEREEPYGRLYRVLSTLKNVPASASKLAVIKEMGSPVLRRTLWMTVFAFGALSVWLMLLQLIDQVPWATANAILTSFFLFLTMAGAFTAWLQLDRRLRRRGAGEASDYRRAAERVSSAVGAPLVLMGHTHVVDFQRFNNGCMYGNSGTWTAIDSLWSRLLRDARSMTFLYVRGGDVELCRWNDDAGRFEETPLFYLGEELPAVEAGFLDTIGDHEHSWLPSSAIQAPEGEAQQAVSDPLTFPRADHQ